MAGNSEDRDMLLIIITLHNASWFHYQVKYSAASLVNAPGCCIRLGSVAR